MPCLRWEWKLDAARVRRLASHGGVHHQPHRSAALPRDVPDVFRSGDGGTRGIGRDQGDISPDV